MVRLACLLLIFFAVSTSLSTKITLIPTEIGETAELTVAEGSHLIIVCVTKDKNPMEWTFNGNNGHRMNVSEERKISSLFTHKFDSSKHTGIYECFEPDSQKSAAVRIYPRDINLPHGYGKCENADVHYCVKGQCGVHLGLGHKDCFCHKGWSGKLCDQPNYSRRNRRNHNV